MSKDADSLALARLHPIWKAIVQLPPARRPGFVVRKALGRARRLCAGMQANSGSVPPYSGRLLPHYQRIDRHYRPAPYPGKVTLLWWEGESEGAEEAARLWSSIAAGGVELHRLPPGVHTELLTGNVEAIANRLKSCLDAVG